MEITKEYSRAYVEVLAVIKHLTEEEYNRIPKSKIEIYEKYKDETYEFIYNPEASLKEQISFEAKNVLSNLFLKYISTPEDRSDFFKKERKEWYEKESKKTYENLNPLFTDISSKDDSSALKYNEISIVEEKKQNLFGKIISKIIKFFKR